MTNILKFPHATRITTGARTDNFARKVIERAHQIAAKPSWVTSDSDLNRKVTHLEERGWKVHFLTIPGLSQVLFHHHQVTPIPNRFLTVDEAMRAQGILEGGTS